jgi:hypothetical protein
VNLLHPRVLAHLSTATLIGLAVTWQVTPLSAQRSDSVMVRSSPVLIKYGKWLTLATAVGMGVKAAGAHDDADRAFARLRQYCDGNAARCTQLSSGSYADPVAEGYYQSSLRHDRRARRWLLGGEITLMGAAGLFVWELTRPKHPSRNIPFEPTITVTPETTQFGLRAAF